MNHLSLRPLALGVGVALLAVGASALPTPVAAGTTPAPGAHDGGRRSTISISIAPGVALVPAGGRLVVLAQPVGDAPPTRPGIPDVVVPDFFALRRTVLAAQEIHGLVPGRPQRVDLDRVVFPERLAAAPPGRYRLQAVLDVNHTYAYRLGTPDDGDLVSAVATVDLPGDAARLPPLTLTERIASPRPADTATVRTIR